MSFLTLSRIPVNFISTHLGLEYPLHRAVNTYPIITYVHFKIVCTTFIPVAQQTLALMQQKSTQNRRERVRVNIIFHILI